MATSMQFLNNFPVKFQNELDSCLECDGRDFCQLAQWNDRFEFAIEPGTTDLTITNGTFTGSLTGWTTTNWTYNAGKARISNSVDTIYQSVSTIASRKYKITFTVSNYTGTGSLDVFLGGVYYGLGGIDHNGTYTVYITPNTSSELLFGCLAATCTLDLDNVTVELVDQDYGIELYNTETGTYSGIRKYANLTNAAISTIGYSYLWSDMGLLYDGCYKIAVMKPGDTLSGPELVTNGTFTTNLSGWTVVTGDLEEWVQLGGAAVVNGSADATSGTAQLKQTLAGLTVGNFYRLTFTMNAAMQSLLANNAANRLTAKLFNSATTSFGQAAGTYTLDVFYTGTSSEIIFRLLTGEINGVPPIDGDDVTLLDTYNGGIDNVSVQLLNTDPEFSECYKLATEHPCETKLLKWTNEATNGFNYPYYYFYNAASSYGFQWMRVECDLRNAKYPGEAEKYIDSGGNNILYLGSVRKLKDFIVGMIPEYMHDALANGFKHKAFYIDGVRYTFEDTDYTPEWSSDIPTVLAESTSLVGKYNQDNNSID